MNKVFKTIKEKFLTKSFIIFCVIGVINTIINSLVMKGVLKVFDVTVSGDISTKEAGIMYYVSMGSATLIAFIAASIFSYFANARFTYNQKKTDGKTFFEASIAFIGRFVITYLFTLLIQLIITLIFNIESDPSGWVRTLSNLIASVLMIPPFYIMLGFVFKRSKNRQEQKEEPKQE